MTPPPRRLEGRRILLVDDDPDILAGMDLAFRGEGATTRLASDGAEALAMLEAEGTESAPPPELVVLDMMLPGASGLLILETIASRAGSPPIVMITANLGHRHRSFAESLGVAAYLVKPVPLELLIQTVATTLADGLGPATPSRPVR